MITQIKTEFGKRTLRRTNRAFATLTYLALLGLWLVPYALGDQDTSESNSTRQRPGTLSREERVKQRERELRQKYSDGSGKLRQDLWLKGIDDIKKLQDTSRTTTLAPAPAPTGIAPAVPLNSVQWVQVGPAPLRIDKEQNFQGAGPDSGQVVDVAIDPRNTSDQVIYIAVNDGGIWKSVNGGTTWAPKTDFMPSLSMGAVGLHPSNPSIVYAGTGNLFNNGFFKAIGLYRSTDAGETWDILNPGGIFNGLGITHVIVIAPNIVLVSTSSGVFRSIDGGVNFGNNAPTFDNGNAVAAAGSLVSDLDVDTAGANTVYASVSGVGILVSTDAGATFPNNLFNNPGAPTTPIGYIDFAQSTQPNNQTMYATVQDARAQTTPPRPSPYPFLGLFKSTDGGANWTRMAGADASGNGCQCGYDQTVGVDPQDANRVYMGFQELYRSTDGGGSFGNVSANKIHFDHHALIFSPASHISGGPPTRIWVGTDGGIHSSTDGGGTWANLNETIATMLFRGIDIGRGSAANRQFSYGGCQDTGTVERRPGFAGLDWHLGVDGDGGPVVVDHVNPMRVYGSDNAYFITTTDGGDNWSFPSSASTGLPGVPNDTSFASAFPVAIDPNNNANVYVKNGAQLFQSTDTGATFTSIRTFPSSILEAATVQIDSGVIWVSLANRTLQRTANALAGTGSTWTSITVNGAPAGLGIGGLAIDPSNPQIAVVVYSGFTGITGNRNKHVFRTTDNGATWTDISGTDGGSQNLPDMPLNAVVIDGGATPHTIIVASDSAVMRTTDNGATWQVLGIGLPSVDCTALALDSSATPSLLRVGTYGRSCFELQVANVPVITVPGDVQFADTCVGTTNNGTLYVCNTGTADLEVGTITSSDPQFRVVTPSSGFPVVISPDFCFPFRVQFAPTSSGDQTTTFVIPSNASNSQTNRAQGFGRGIRPDIAVLMANSGSFGDVCLGSFRDLNLTINNPGGCPLVINDITSTSPHFVVPTVLFYPLVIHPGDSIAVPIRFQPTSLGPKTGTITVVTPDPSVPNRLVSVSGNVPPGDVRVTGSTDFGEVCAGTLAEKTISICNVGKCNLLVSNVAFSPACPDFTLVNNPFPAIVSHDSCVDVVIRYTPTSCGDKQCRLVIITDDPDTPVITLIVTASTPCASIDVPPDMAFPPTVISSFGPCRSLLPFPISNTGTCPLWITDVKIGGPQAAEYSLVGLPSFPIILEQGHIVGEGDLSLAFSPAEMGRERHGTITVTYIVDPIAGTTASVTRELCGEGVSTGGRVLVMQGNIPVPKVEKIQLQRINANRNKDPLDTHDVIQDALLVTSVPGTPCEAFQYHREYGTVSNPIQLLPGSYQVTVSAIINGKRKSKTVGFDVDTCTFNPQIVIKY